MNQVTLRRASLADQEALKQIRLYKHQHKYSGDGENLIQFVNDKDKAVYLIYLDEQPAGCFYLAFQDMSLKEFTKKSYAVLFSLSIGQHYQDKGIAKQAMLHLTKVFKILCPELEAIMLTVNCENKAAQILYKKVGFVDMGKLYYGGKSGPQHVYIFSAD
ncbi:MAG: hypothetical protein A3E87_00445 [Gammaproteobacteria bacterium RIFCSPHIGHO2_12_FULL_35_23]|nr:MAG: hypothetical protein A3E87_00445 [Gammaproteobacteria bacterium RIFCSPHIGHO2_12_FULL_35_23]